MPPCSIHPALQVQQPESQVTSEPPQISVIIPTYNAGRTVNRCLQALANQTAAPGSYEIVVVDDGSTDDTCAVVQTQSQVRLYTQNHAGPAAARNLGVAQARAPIVLFTDADCEPAANWIERMAAPLLTGGHDPDTPIIGVKGTYLTRQREIMARFVQIEYEDKYDRMARDRYIDFVDTYSAGYQRDVFLANGGFDPSFPVASVEDQELSFRLAKQGYKMVFVPEAHVYHLGHPHDLAAYWRKKFKIGYWKVLVQRRHPDKLWRDSHTPQILKVQMLLVALGGTTLVAGLFWPPVWWLTGALGLLFFLSTLPFAIKAWCKDMLVSLLSPALLFIRALALDMGFAAGLIMNRGPKPTQRP
jgi:glycosyltransferase involved in cell wall biosynthesis